MGFAGLLIGLRKSIGVVGKVKKLCGVPLSESQQLGVLPTQEDDKL